MSDGLTEEERRLLSQNAGGDDADQKDDSDKPDTNDKPKRRGRRATAETDDKGASSETDKQDGERGSETPAQYGGDGWGDTPAQMRG